jgi:hypothetical protein
MTTKDTENERIEADGVKIVFKDSEDKRLLPQKQVQVLNKQKHNSLRNFIKIPFH